MLTRFGDGVLPEKETVVQDSDLVHVTMRWDDRDAVIAAFAAGPSEAGQH